VSTDLRSKQAEQGQNQRRSPQAFTDHTKKNSKSACEYIDTTSSLTTRENPNKLEVNIHLLCIQGHKR